MKIKGIVINSLDYKESSKIVNLYTKTGKIGVLAQGAKRIKNGMMSFTTTGNIVEAVLTDTKLPKVVEYNLVNSMYDLTSDIDKINALFTILDIVGSLPEDIDNNSTFLFIEGILNALKKTNSPSKILSIFLIKILYSFGVNPNLKSCVKTGSSNIYGFSPSLGGATVMEYNKNHDLLLIWTEYYYDKKDYESFSDTNYLVLINSIKEYYDLYMPIKLKKL